MRLLISVAVAALLASAPAAQARSPGAVFDQADLNHDGYVTRAEFADARWARLRRLDRDGDGVLSQSELRRLSRIERAKPLVDAVRRADANGDGRITAQEFRAAPAPLFELSDRNQDGRLDAAEIAAAREMAERR